MAVQNFQLLTWDGIKQKRIDSESTEIKFGKLSLAVIGDVEAAFAQEASDRAAGDAATLSSAQAYTDSAIAAVNVDIDADISNLQSGLAQEILDRAAGDVATLADAKAYADQKITDLVGAAPATLDTLKEIADAIANDASIAATLTASIASVQGEVDAVEVALAAETAAREAADDALDARLDFLESDKEILEYANLAAFPASGEAGKLYVAKDSNLLYRYAETVLPESYDFVVGAGGDFATLHDALASASVLDGHKIKILNGTYQSDVQLNITKKVKIYGESRAGVILQTSASTAAPVSMINVSVDDVVLKGLTIKHRKTNNTSVETAVVASGSGFPQTRIRNFIIDDCLVEHVEFGVVVRGEGWKISNNTISYTGATNSTRRHIGVYGLKGDVFVKSNVFKDNAASGTVRAIALTSTTGSNPNETNEGNLVVEGNTQEGPMAQFISQDNFQGSAGSYKLYVKNNTTNETSAFVSFYGVAANFGDILSEVVVQGNSISHNHDTATGLGKGLIGIDGAGSIAFRSSALPVHASSNTLGQLAFRADYAEATGSSGSIVGFKPAVFGSVSVSQDTVIPSFPSAPATPSAGGGVSASYVKLIDLDGLQAELDAEEARALAAEAALDVRLDVLEGSGAGSVAKAQLDAQAYADAAVLVEKTRAEAAESALQGEVDAAEASIAQEILDRAAAVSAEQARAEAAELALQGEVDAVESGLAQELLDRAAADTALQGSIDTVAGGLAQELLDRAAADTALQGEIDAVEADLAQELLDRAAAVAAVQAEVDAEEVRAAAAELALQGEIDAEETRALAAEAAIQAEVDALEVVVSELNLISKSADEAIAAGQICYVKSNGSIALADADLDLSDAALVIASEAIALAATGKVVIKEGAIVGGFSGLVPGKKCFVSKTAGEVVQSLTGFASGNSVYCVGRAISATEIAFQPVFEFEY